MKTWGSYADQAFASITYAKGIGPKIDVHQPIESRGTLSVKTLELRGNLISDQKIEFVHMEQSYPLEFRISAVSDGHKGSFTFHGVKLTRSGDSPRKKMNNANHIRPC